ncbi:MAG: hypothetical protein HGN29_06595 [Asgard group archaeon]|nr:hypothetical protein [Asgard group archaeon]
MINDKYPVRAETASYFSFFGAKLGSLGIIIYYVSEMLNRLIFYNSEAEYIIPSKNWSMIDSGIYVFALFILASQVAIWRGVFKSYEYKKRARNAFIGIVGAALFTGLFEVLIQLMPNEQRLQSDNTVPFLLMILFHLYGILQLKAIIRRIGRMNRTETGKAVLYTLFAANPAIRYLASFIILFAGSAFFINPYFYMYYADLVMIYVTGAISIGFFLFIYLDSRKIKIAQMMDALKQQEEEAEAQTS